MAYTTTQRDALQAALASGALTVRYGDVSTTYRSVSELREALKVVETALAKAAGNTPLRQVRVSTDRGY